MKKFLKKMFLATILVSGFFVVFYYSIGRLYILRWNISFGEISNVIYSPPRLSKLFILNLAISLAFALFYLTDFIVDLAEKKFKEKKEGMFDFRKLDFVPLFYIIFFSGFLLASKNIITNVEKYSPIINKEKVLDLINDYRDKFKRPAYEESEFSCNLALEKLAEMGTNKTSGMEVGGKGFEEVNGSIYAYNFIKNVGREEQVLFWWQQDMDLDDTIQITNFSGVEITKACVKADYGKDYSTVVLVVSNL